MNILMASHRLARHSIGGTEVLTASVADALVQRGHRVVWLAVGTDHGGSPSDPINTEGYLECEVQPSSAQGYPHGWYEAEASVARQVQTTLTKLGITFSVVHLFHLARIGLQWLDSALPEVPVVMTLTDYTLICPDHQLFHRTMQKICTGLRTPLECALCLAEPTTEAEIATWRERNLTFLNSRVTSVYTQTPEQCRILVNAGVQPHRIVSTQAKYAIPKAWQIRQRPHGHPFRFGYVGRLSPEKGLDVILQAFARVHQRTGSELWIYGAPDPSELSYSRKLQEQMQQASVTFCSPVALEQLGDVMQQFDCLVIPSQWLENHPTVLTYALALSIPVLSSAVPSLTHLVGQAGLDFVRHFSDPDDWALAMEDVVRRSEALRGRGDRMLAFREEFDRYVDTLEQHYTGFREAYR